MVYEDFEKAAGRSDTAKARDYSQYLAQVEPARRKLFLIALNYGFNCQEIEQMISSGSLTEKTLADIVQQRIDDNTSEIQA